LISALKIILEAYLEIPNFTVLANSCSGGIANLDGPRQRVQQFNHPGHLRHHHPRHHLPAGRVYLLIDGLAKTTFDGNGNLTQVDAVATNGNLAPGWRPGTGTYSVNPDCTGTQTIMVPGLPDLHLQFIVAQSGNTIHQIVIDPGIATTAEGERVELPKQ